MASVESAGSRFFFSFFFCMTQNVLTYQIGKERLDPLVEGW